MADMRTKAVALANRGFKVFPLEPLSKVPKKGFMWNDPKFGATCDPKKVEEMWTDGPTQRSLDWNIGIAGGESPSGLRLAVVDVDVKGVDNGMKWADAWELGHEPPCTMRVKTPSGGRHDYYMIPADLPMLSSKNGGWPGIDIKAAGGYVVGPGSRLLRPVSEEEIELLGSDDPVRVPYVEVNGSKVLDMPKSMHRELFAKVGAPGTKAIRAVVPTSSTHIGHVQLDTPQAIAKARDWLMRDEVDGGAPAVAKGARSDDNTRIIAARLRDMGLSEAKALEVLTEEDGWNDTKSSPPWPHNKLAVKVHNGFKYAQNPIPQLAPAAAEFSEVAPEDLAALPPASGDGRRKNDDWAARHRAAGGAGSPSDNDNDNDRPDDRYLGPVPLDPHNNPMTVIHFEGQRLTRVGDDVIQAIHADHDYLALAGKPGLGLDGYALNWGGRIASVVTKPYAGARRMDGTCPPEPMVNILNLHSLRSRLMHTMYFVKRDGRGSKGADAANTKWSGCMAPDQVMQEVMSRGGTGLPTLNGIIEAPTMRSDGTILDRPGYDPASGLFAVLNPETQWLPVMDNPDQLDAQDALNWLEKKFFADCRFATATDRSVAVAALLTTVARRALPGYAPAFVFTSPSVANGKTTLVQMICSAVYGRPTAPVGWPSDETERNKTIFTLLSEGRSSILFDNVGTGSIVKSDVLAQALTSSVFTSRTLGVSASCAPPTNCMWFFTGNNIQLTADLASRSLSCYIDAKTDHPERLAVTRLDPEHWSALHRAEVVQNALIIMRAYAHAGCPDVGTGDRNSRFREWDMAVRRAIIWAGGEDVGVKFDEGVDNDPQYEAEAVALHAIHEATKGAPFTVAELLRRVKQSGFFEDGADPAQKELEERMATAVVELEPNDKHWTVKMLAAWFKKRRLAVIDGMKIAEAGKDASGRLGRWAVVPA